MIYIRTSGKNGRRALNVAKTKWPDGLFAFTEKDPEKWETDIDGIKVISHYRMYREWNATDFLVVPENFFCSDLSDELTSAGIPCDSVYVCFDDELIKADEFIYLDYLEYHVNDHCNLNCKSCSHFCPLVTEPVFVDFDQTERDLYRLKELVCQIKKIRIMGGEPLLNSELPRYINVTRRVFPYSDIRLVTNGLLIKTLGNDVWNAIKNNNVRIDISIYPPMLKTMDMCISEINKHECRVGGLHQVSRFEKIMHSPEPYKMDNTNSCICNNIRDGYIASCPMVFCGKYYNDYFGEQVPFESGKINLYEIENGKELLERLNTPFDLCNYCRNYMLGINASTKGNLWERISGIKDCRLEDWNE